MNNTYIAIGLLTIITIGTLQTVIQQRKIKEGFNPIDRFLGKIIDDIVKAHAPEDFYIAVKKKKKIEKKIPTIGYQILLTFLKIIFTPIGAIAVLIITIMTIPLILLFLNYFLLTPMKILWYYTIMPVIKYAYGLQQI